MDKHERLRLARVDAGFPDAVTAARRFGWPETTYRAHENGGRGYTIKSAQEYARAFRVTAQWLLLGDGEPALDTTEPADDLVSVYDVQAGAGNGIVVHDEAAVAQLAFPPGYLAQLTRARPADLAIIGVKGDSMLPTLADDDLVMIDRTKLDLSFDGLFVIRDGGDALLVKRIGRASKRGFVSIISDNRNVYPAVEKAIEEIEVIGRVIWKGGKV